MKCCYRLLFCLLFLPAVLFPSALHSQELERDITFCKVDGVDLQMNLARPSQGTGPFPALLFIHGGGWMSGDREEFDEPAREAARRGYVAVTVDYRLTNVINSGKTKYLFPSQLYDVKAAVRWLRSNSEKYHIRKDRIGAFGYSAGGHLALLLGLTKPSDGLEGDVSENDSSIQAVVSCGGQTDLSSCPASSAYKIGKLLGGSPAEVPDAYAKASPVNYVRNDSPPTLIITGEMDRDVPAEQARLLDRKMTEVGATHLLIVRPLAGHVMFSSEPEIWDFLDRYLKG